ncbi:MAG: hypothetical protein Q8P41_25435 [Pseudomonadota bacterium]|nr:hypothetical protein [Pseudomonadota bacterium]
MFDILAAYLGLGGLAAAVVLARLLWIYTTWERDARWLEASRDRKDPRIRAAKHVYFNWIHRDAEYWIYPLDLSRTQQVRVTGTVPSCLYFSLNYTGPNFVRSYVTSGIREATHDEGEAFSITLDPRPAGDTSRRKGVLYLRIYLRNASDRTPLPAVEVRP